MGKKNWILVGGIGFGLLIGLLLVWVYFGWPSSERVIQKTTAKLEEVKAQAEFAEIHDLLEGAIGFFREVLEIARERKIKLGKEFWLVRGTILDLIRLVKEMKEIDRQVRETLGRLEIESQNLMEKVLEELGD